MTAISISWRLARGGQVSLDDKATRRALLEDDETTTTTTTVAAPSDGGGGGGVSPPLSSSTGGAGWRDFVVDEACVEAVDRVVAATPQLAAVALTAAIAARKPEVVARLLDNNVWLDADAQVTERNVT